MNNPRFSISERIKAVVDEIKYPVIADIGCDHAYTSIYSLLTGKAAYAYACDINKGPLKHAENNILKNKLSHKIEVRLGPGLLPLCGVNVETIIISGMGGFLTERILSEGLVLVPGVEQLILQPQSDFRKVREYIHKAGFRIVSEHMLNDGPKFYTILNCLRGTDSPYSLAENEFGRVSLQKCYSVFFQFIKAEISKTEIILREISESGAKPQSRRQELTERLGMLRRIYGASIEGK